MSTQPNRSATLTNLLVFANVDAAETWLQENDPEGVAFESWSEARTHSDGVAKTEIDHFGNCPVGVFCFCRIAAGRTNPRRYLYPRLATDRSLTSAASICPPRPRPGNFNRSDRATVKIGALGPQNHRQGQCSQGADSPASCY